MTPRRGRAERPPHLPPLEPSPLPLPRPWLNLPPPRHLLPRASYASRWDSITLGLTGGESCESWRCPSCPCFHSPANDIHLLPSCPIAPTTPNPLLYLRSPFHAPLLPPQPHPTHPSMAKRHRRHLPPPSPVSTVTLVPLQLQLLSSREQGVSGG